MEAILLCAGFGARLYPLTMDRPKPLLRVARRPALDYLMEQLVRLPQLTSIHLVTNDRFFDQFAAWRRSWETALGRGEVQLRLHNDGCRDNENRLGAVGDLAFVLRSLKAPTAALVAAGDNIFRFSLGPIWRMYLRAGANLLVALPESDPQKLRRTGILEIGPDDRVVRFHEKPANPASSWTCPALYFLQASALSRVDEYLTQPDAQDAPGHFIAYLVGREPVYAMKIQGARLDIGSIAAYEEADAILRREPTILNSNTDENADDAEATDFHRRLTRANPSNLC